MFGIFNLKEKKMHFWIGVENFAKIESAKICVDNYTVLVGENNSGKTFLMQLVQGVGKQIVNLIDETIMNEFLVEETDVYRYYEIDYMNVSKLVFHINEKLLVEKENIVKKIFGKDIDIGRLYIDISIDENTIYNLLMYDSRCKDKEKRLAIINKAGMDAFFVEIENGLLQTISSGMDRCIVNKKNNKIGKSEIVSVYVRMFEMENNLYRKGLRSIIEARSLFLPASRTGLMLLYREFFASKTDKELSYVIKDNRVLEITENYGNLTQPMYGFLRFLQTYSEEEMEKLYKEELKFFEEHLIEGHIGIDKQGTFSYNSKNEKGTVPMYLASSMLNEVAPLALAITSKNHYQRLIIDEAEASLHPQKQLELVRFFNRLNNKGMSLIVSTHSDTFVSKLNNLYILSEQVKRCGEDILKQFNLEKEDLIEPERLFVYEFVNQPNGKSIVKEIKGNSKTGYQFDLFTDSAMHLYEEATKLGEIQE